MSYTARLSEQMELIDSVSPASYDAEQNTGAFSLANYSRIAVVIHAGVIGGDVDVDIEQAKTSSGSLASFDSASKDITLTATTDNNTISVIEIRPEEFTAGYSYINVELTPASAGIFGVQVWGEPVYKPAATTNLDSVTD